MRQLNLNTPTTLTIKNPLSIDLDFSFKLTHQEETQAQNGLIYECNLGEEGFTKIITILSDVLVESDIDTRAEINRQQESIFENITQVLDIKGIFEIDFLNEFSIYQQQRSMIQTKKTFTLNKDVVLSGFIKANSVIRISFYPSEEVTPTIQNNNFSIEIENTSNEEQEFSLFNSDSTQEPNNPVTIKSRSGIHSYEDICNSLNANNLLLSKITFHSNKKNNLYQNIKIDSEYYKGGSHPNPEGISLAIHFDAYAMTDKFVIVPFNPATKLYNNFGIRGKIQPNSKMVLIFEVNTSNN